MVSPQVRQKRDEEELEDDLSSAAESLYRYVKVARNAKIQQKKKRKKMSIKGNYNKFLALSQSPKMSQQMEQTETITGDV